MNIEGEAFNQDDYADAILASKHKADII